MSRHRPDRLGWPKPHPQLPAFCRTRTATDRTTVVRVRSLRTLQRLILLTLVLQFCTLVLVIAGPLPRPVPRPSLPADLAFLLPGRPSSGTASSSAPSLP